MIEPIHPVAGRFRGSEAVGALAGIAVAEAGQIAFVLVMQDALTPVTGVAFRGRGWLWMVPLVGIGILPPLLGTVGAYLAGSAPRTQTFAHAVFQNITLHLAEAVLADISLVVGALTGYLERGAGGDAPARHRRGAAAVPSAWSLHEVPYRAAPAVLHRGGASAAGARRAGAAPGRCPRGGGPAGLPLLRSPCSTLR